MSRIGKLRFLLVVLGCFSAVGCGWLRSLVETREVIDRVKDTQAPFYSNESFGRAPPVVKMWQQFYRGTSASQQEIWDFMQSNPQGGFWATTVHSRQRSNWLWRISDRLEHIKRSTI